MQFFNRVNNASQAKQPAQAQKKQPQAQKKPTQEGAKKDNNAKPNKKRRINMSENDFKAYQEFKKAKKSEE